jgi:hypothetical protein
MQWECGSGGGGEGSERFGFDGNQRRTLTLKATKHPLHSARYTAENPPELRDDRILI